MSRGNRAEGLALDSTVGGVSNVIESTGNLATRSATWLKKQRQQIADIFKSNPENKRYKKIGNVPVTLINGVLVPANAVLGLGHKGLQAVEALGNMGINGVKWLQKTILGKDVAYKPLINTEPKNRLAKKLSSGLRLGYFGDKKSTSKPKDPETEKK